jgi:hypothetical protein
MWSFAGIHGSISRIRNAGFELTPYIQFLIVAGIVFLMMLSTINFNKSQRNYPTQEEKLFSNQCADLVGNNRVLLALAKASVVRLSVYFKDVIKGRTISHLGIHFFYDYDGRRTFLRRRFDW